jgi:hypothetical protein
MPWMTFCSIYIQERFVWNIDFQIQIIQKECLPPSNPPVLLKRLLQITYLFQITRSSYCGPALTANGSLNLTQQEIFIKQGTWVPCKIINGKSMECGLDIAKWISIKHE